MEINFVTPLIDQHITRLLYLKKSAQNSIYRYQHMLNGEFKPTRRITSRSEADEKYKFWVRRHRWLSDEVVRLSNLIQ